VSRNVVFWFLSHASIAIRCGEFKKTANHAAPFGKNVLVVTGSSSFRASGKLDELCDSLGEGYWIIETSGEPSPDLIDATVAEFRKTRVSLVIAWEAAAL